jgi:hypothetical protein
MAHLFFSEFAEPEEYWWHIWLRQPGHRDGEFAPEMMTAPEQMFFLGAPLAHVLAYEEHLKSLRASTRRSNGARLSRLIKCSVQGFPGADTMPLPGACAA